jgi:hypothetical protein
MRDGMFGDITTIQRQWQWQWQWHDFFMGWSSFPSNS